MSAEPGEYNSRPFVLADPIPDLKLRYNIALPTMAMRR